MKKTFTIQQITHKVVSPQRGSLTWLLSDEHQQARKVNAITVLGRNQAIAEVRAVHVREMPLVDALLNQEEGETFALDFTAFNHDHGYAEREVYANLQTCEQLGKLGSSIWKVLATGGVLVCLWLAWLLYGSMTEFAKQQPTVPHELSGTHSRLQ